MDKLIKLLDPPWSDYASWVDEPGYWQSRGSVRFRPLAQAVARSMRVECWRAFSLGEQTVAMVERGEDRFAGEEPAGKPEPQQQTGRQPGNDVAESKVSADDAESQSAQQFPCPQAKLGCKYVGKSQRAVNAHQRFCEYREQP